MLKNRKPFPHQKLMKRKTPKKSSLDAEEALSSLSNGDQAYSFSSITSPIYSSLSNPLQNLCSFDILDSKASREEIDEVVIVSGHVAEQEDDIEEVCKSDFYVMLSKRFVDTMEMSF
ncbi:hypothetical protein M9H77_29944 [Catharanthus roseus]|uniref:Uncharacterized protein n=1 Tax=Catharanthus roseus TaxID=4058 RepID=A0ACB9ZYG1_CATRO|nr:hypothetical protein M9H77_29944 [Catharanthus roseus]